MSTRGVYLDRICTAAHFPDLDSQGGRQRVLQLVPNLEHTRIVTKFDRNKPVVELPNRDLNPLFIRDAFSCGSEVAKIKGITDS